jgi:hypothetical protein
MSLGSGNSSAGEPETNMIIVTKPEQNSNGAWHLQVTSNKERLEVRGVSGEQRLKKKSLNVMMHGLKGVCTQHRH